MLDGIWNALAPRNCWDLEKRRVAGAVRAVGMCFVIGILPALYLQWANEWRKGFLILLATEAASLVAIALNRVGMTDRAAATLSWAGFLCGCSMVVFSREGYHDLAMLLFPAMLATAALLLSGRPYIFFASFVVLAAAILILLQIYGLNPNARHPGNYFDLLNVAIILTLISLSLSLLSNAMRRSVTDYRTLIEQAGEGVIVLDEERRISMCNASAAEIFGLSPPALVGCAFEEFVPPEALSTPPPGDSAGRVSLPVTVKHADGSPRYVLVTCTPRFGDQSQQNGIIAVLRDTTRSRQVEDALEESRRRFQSLLEQGHFVTLLLDTSGTVTFCNDTLLDLLGASREDTVGRTLSDILARHSGDEYEKDFEEALRMEKPHTLRESVLVDAQGRPRWFQWSVTPLRAVDGSVKEFACVGLEITEQRMLREQYLQALKLDSIGRLAGGVAHDFNNLLTVINGYSSMLMDALPDGDANRIYASQINEAGAHAAGLTKQLLTFSRRQAIRRRPTDVGGVVRDSEYMLERVIGEDVRLVTTVDQQSLRVMADPDQIRQVIMNLAANARDAMPDGGKLEIAARVAVVAAPYQSKGIPAGDYVLLAVTDSGVGMDAETMQHLFEPFFTTKGQGKGTGLGLATVYGIVKQNGGWIDVASQPGSGTSVKIYLPRTDAPVMGEEAPIANFATALGETILIVEDQDTVRQLVADVLRQYGYSTLEASSAEEALRVLRRAEAPAIDLVLTDVILPGMNGRELADQILKDTPGSKVLFMSGYAGDALGRRGVLEDGVALLQKPFTPAALIERVRNILSSKA